MRPVLFVLLMAGVCTTQACDAQTPPGPFSNAKSIWETPAPVKSSNASSLNIDKPNVQAQKPLRLPAQHHSAPMSQQATFQYPGSSAPGSIIPASFEQQQTSKQKSSGIKTVSSNRPALPLRKPGEKLSKQDKESEANKKRLGSTSQQLGTTTLVLGGIIAIILFASRFMKKHTRLGTMNLSSQVLEVLGRKMLDQKHSIHYVLCGNRILILGTSLEGIRTLAEITDPVEIDRIRGECKPIPVETAIGNSFGFLLSKTERETEQVDLDKQHRRRQKKRSSSKRIRKDKDQQPAPNLADYGLTLDELRKGQS